MSYLTELSIKYKLWKHWKPSGQLSQLGFIPSQTCVKYPIDSTFNGQKVLNVGCGGNVYKASNINNTDLFDGPGVQLAWDLSKTPMPFNDGEFDHIIANHVLEHVPNWFECFKELARIVKIGGIIEVWIPPISSDGAFAFRDHINYIGLTSFMGIQGCSRPGTNLHAKNEFASLNVLESIELIMKQSRPAMKWWIWFAPNWLLNWMATYLRNIISEEGYFFRKSH